MTVTITLVIPVGGAAGPFDLYSDTDGYANPFATNIDASTLVAGYTSTAVPNGATIIRVTSLDQCKNSIDIPVSIIPTTTSTTTVKSSCSIYTLATTGPGGTGETDWSAIDCNTGLPVGETVPYPGSTSTGCIVDSSLTYGPKVAVLSSISCDPIVFEVESPCCDLPEVEYIELPYYTVAGDVIYATNGYCYRVVRDNLFPVTITLGDPTIYTDCVDCLAAHPCPTTTTTTTTIPLINAITTFQNCNQACGNVCGGGLIYYDVYMTQECVDSFPTIGCAIFFTDKGVVFPDGTYNLGDGTCIVITDGIITDIIPSTTTTTTTV